MENKTIYQKEFVMTPVEIIMQYGRVMKRYRVNNPVFIATTEFIRVLAQSLFHNCNVDYPTSENAPKLQGLVGVLDGVAVVEDVKYPSVWSPFWNPQWMLSGEDWVLPSPYTDDGTHFMWVISEMNHKKFTLIESQPELISGFKISEIVFNDLESAKKFCEEENLKIIAESSKEDS